MMKARILVADDERDILDMLFDFLTGLGYQVDLAQSVDNAFALINKNEYDIFLTDKNMPDRSGNREGGMTLLRYAREYAPSTEVIMITGYATVRTAVEAMKLGAFDYIMKPVPLNDLNAKIERVLQYRQFIDSERTLGVYKKLHHQVLELLINRENLPDERLQSLLRSLGGKIDHIFGIQKEYETIIDVQAKALEKIKGYATLLMDAFPENSPYAELVEKIREESEKRI
ncbi:MAG: response regulator [Deltaproteobacteria bacterium]|nr:response regulator [Deltaproteobacteria bacterium]